MTFFDWITPTRSLLNRNTETFVVPASSDSAVVAALRHAGIKYKYAQHSRGKFTFDVDKRDAGKVRRLLRERC